MTVFLGHAFYATQMAMAGILDCRMGRVTVCLIYAQYLINLEILKIANFS